MWGTQLSVPDVGDYYALPQEGEGRALLRTPAGRVELISNVCRHRQAVILKGRGSSMRPSAPAATSSARCTAGPTAPAAAAGGTLLGAPHFAHDPCLNLNNYKLQEWNGLLFEDNGRDIAADLAGMGPRADLDFTGIVLDRVELHECNYNWKTFIEVYLEDYHVGPFHPGLGNFVTCDDLRWEFKDNYSVQTVGVANRLGKAGSPVYERWQKALLNYRKGEPPQVRRDLAHLLPAHHGRVVPARADRLDAAPDRAAEDAERGGVLLPRGDRRLRARVRRGPAGRLHGDLRRGRRDRASAWTPAARR